MLEGMWQNWDIDALLVELWTDPTILDGNLQLCTKSTKKLPAFWSIHTIAGFVPQKDHKEKDLYKNIFSCTLCSGKNLENEGMPFNWEMAKHIVVSAGDGILLCSKE